MLEIFNKIHVVNTQFGIGGFSCFLFLLCCATLLLIGNKRMKLAMSICLVALLTLSFTPYACLIGIGTTNNYASRYLIIPILLFFGFTVIQVWERIQSKGSVRKIFFVLLVIFVLYWELRGTFYLRNTKYYIENTETETEDIEELVSESIL